MSLSLAAIQPPEKFKDLIIKTSYGFTVKEEVYVDYFPYTNLEWVKAVEELKITVPERFKKLITAADGVSTCKVCGHRVAGKQNSCNNKVFKYADYYGRLKHPEDKNFKFKGDKAGSGYWSYTVTSHGEEECAGSMSWDHESKFNEQRSFYQWLNQLYYNQDVEMTEFGYTAENPLVLISYLENKAKNQELEIQSLKNAIKMIAEKMNAAGGNLMF
jgi:hypothetical protein